MSTDAARVAVRRHAERYKVNYEWLAKHPLVGASSRTIVRNWLIEGQEPRDPQTWMRMAEALGIYNPASSRIASLARDLAVEVLERSDDPELKQRAALVVKEAFATYR